MERNTPYSHTASVMFCVIEISSKKKVIASDITEIMATKIEKTTVTLWYVVLTSCLVSKMPVLPTN